MKKAALSFLFSLILFTSFAQTDVLFPDSNARWSTALVDGFGNYTGDIKYYTGFQPNDTIVNGLSYHKIYVRNMSVWSGPPNGYHCSIRKDYTGQKVYILPKDSTNEYLLYDFSKGVLLAVYYLE